MSEWRRGWRVVLGAGIAAGTGINLLFYVFSIFIPHIQRETGWTMGEFSRMQAVIGLGSLTAPLAGWAMDRYGLKRVYALGMAALVPLYLIIATGPLSAIPFTIGVFVAGMVGVATSAIAYTRAVAVRFVQHRGFALALAASGLSVSVIIFPPIFAALIEAQGWRAGYVLLAALAGLVGLPVVLFLIGDTPRLAALPSATADDRPPVERFTQAKAFWLIVVAVVTLNLPGAGLLSQMVPVLVEEGASPALAALGISLFAGGQFAGRLGCGWLLDRMKPQWVAFAFTIVPATGCLLLWAVTANPYVALAAVALVGVQQGAEIDLLAYFIARRFGTARYGTIFGWIMSAGWMGTLGGILLLGHSHDVTGSYSLFQLVAAFAYLLGAVAMLLVDLPEQGPVARDSG